MSQSTSSNQQSLMPPIIYTSERVDPKTNQVHTQQPRGGNNVTSAHQNLGPDPMLIKCPKCAKNVTTRVDYEAGETTHNCALFLCLCDSDMVCLPYCMDSMKDANHYCPSCQTFLGKYRRPSYL